MPNFHFAVKGHPTGFVIEGNSESEALDKFNLLSFEPLSGIHGFNYHDVEGISVIPEKTYYLLGKIKVF